MIADLRREFNAKWTRAKYDLLLRAIHDACGVPIGFRHNETPVFLPRDLLDTMARSGREMLAQIVGNRDYLAQSAATISEKFRVPNEAAQPMFVQADFGIVKTETGYEPRLVEIQGFPSLYGYQPALAQIYRRVYDLDPTLRTLLSDLDYDAYWALLRHALLGDHAPENVVLLELDPESQKTRCDFILTERMTKVRAVNLRDIVVEGRKLHYPRDGKLIPIHRIYNRAIIDELERKGVEAPFRWDEEYDVEWAGHPNWYFHLSKFSIPFLRHPHVPETFFLDRVSELPPDLDNWVLKPLFSFAGLGVVVGPTLEQVAAVSPKSDYILQRRMNFAPVIDTPAGATQVEVRIMYLWFDGGAPQPVGTIIRTGRGRMMGVDHNKNMDWVGASAAFYR